MMATSSLVNIKYISSLSLLSRLYNLLLVGDRIYLFYGWNKGSQPPLGEKISRTDMQLDEGFWMRWSDDFGKTFDSGRTLIPVMLTILHLKAS